MRGRPGPSVAHYYVKDPNDVHKLFIRDHKTFGPTGTLIIPLTRILATLMDFWVAKIATVVQEVGH